MPVLPVVVVVMRVIVIVMMTITVPMVVTLRRRFGLLIPQHHRFQHLAHRVFVQRHVAGEKARQPRQHQ